MTTSPGVNIAGTVSLLPDPGTIPPVPLLKNILDIFFINPPPVTALPTAPCLPNL